MSAKITMTVEQLEDICREQRSLVGNYLTGNLSHLGEWWAKIDDLSLAKETIKKRANNAPLPEEVLTLTKYLKS